MKGGFRIRYFIERHPCFALNKLCRAGVTAKAVRREGEGASFSLGSDEADRGERVMLGSGVKFVRLYESGFFAHLKALKGKAALLVSLAAAIAGTALYSFSVDSVRVTGVNRVDENAVLEMVREELPSPFILPGEDFSAAERKLLNIDGVAYASVGKSGRDIIVKIVEELPEVPLLNTQNPIPLPAKEGGVITKIVVLNGTKRVEAGDTVTKGEILIEPFIVSDSGERIATRAMGIVEAKVRRTERVECPAEGSAAELVLERKEAFEAALEEDARLIDYSFEVKKVDKKAYLDLYYDIITRI